MSQVEIGQRVKINQDYQSVLGCREAEVFLSDREWVGIKWDDSFGIHNEDYVYVDAIDYPAKHIYTEECTLLRTLSNFGPYPALKSAVGVYGINSSASGQTYGVYGCSQSVTISQDTM